jgi:hypothetical protein
VLPGRERRAVPADAHHGAVASTGTGPRFRNQRNGNLIPPRWPARRGRGPTPRLSRRRSGVQLLIAGTASMRYRRAIHASHRHVIPPRRIGSLMIA